MEYRELGKTGLKVPVLSYGASSLGGVFHSIKESEAIQSVFTAVEHGRTLLMFLHITDIIRQKQYWVRLLRSCQENRSYFQPRWDVMARMVLIHGTTRASAHRKVYTKVWNV